MLLWGNKRVVTMISGLRCPSYKDRLRGAEDIDAVGEAPPGGQGPDLHKILTGKREEVERHANVEHRRRIYSETEKRWQRSSLLFGGRN